MCSAPLGQRGITSRRHPRHGLAHMHTTTTHSCTACSAMMGTATLRQPSAAIPCESHQAAPASPACLSCLPLLPRTSCLQAVVNRAKRAVPYPVLGENTLVLADLLCVRPVAGGKGGEMELVCRRVAGWEGRAGACCWVCRCRKRIGTAICLPARPHAPAAADPHLLLLCPTLQGCRHLPQPNAGGGGAHVSLSLAPAGVVPRPPRPPLLHPTPAGGE